MTTPDWRLAYGPSGFQNALAQGVQMGNTIRERKEQAEYRNALAQFDPSNPETLKPIMEARPEVGIHLRQQVQEQQAAQRQSQLTSAFLQGDEAAGEELARMNFDRWKSIDSRQKQDAIEEAQILGNAAIDILRLPPEQRGQAVAAYAQNMPQYAEDIGRVAQLPPDQLEQALRTQVANAKMIGKLHQMERPDYMAIPQGGTLVDTRNPQAVQQFGQQGQIPTINSPDEARALPPGTQFRTPDGRLMRVPGGTAGNGGGGF